ncbi:MAG: hypothetical protein HYT70_01265 [Candidatus Aenigmarchaeota archaeon]|nr:hypothetical protein [Candidatus Aenigmarchaeota archaeon]
MQSSTIEQKLESMPPNFLASLICGINDKPELSRKLLSYFMRKKGSSGIYLTLDKPGMTIKEEMIRNKIPVENLYFVDLISEASGAGIQRDNILFSNSPSNLTEISIIISGAIKNMKAENKFLIFDTLSTLFSYNPQPLALKFTHFMSTMIKNLNVSGVFIIIRNQLDERAVSFISGFVDETIEI